MLSLPSRGRALAFGAVCAAAGAGAGTVAVAGASSAPHHRSAVAHWRRAHRLHGRRGALARRTVHGEFVVRTRTGFATATVDRGTIDSVSGDQLTLTDGTLRANYQQETITVPATARVRNDRRPASLSSLTAGERAVVVQLPQRTIVLARTPRTSKTTSTTTSSTTSSAPAA